MKRIKDGDPLARFLKGQLYYEEVVISFLSRSYKADNLQYNFRGKSDTLKKKTTRDVYDCFSH